MRVNESPGFHARLNLRFKPWHPNRSILFAIGISLNIWERLSIKTLMVRGFGATKAPCTIFRRCSQGFVWCFALAGKPPVAPDLSTGLAIIDAKCFKIQKSPLPNSRGSLR